jgi:hypothetical protein
LDRFDAEMHFSAYFLDRGIVRSTSPGNVLNSLIHRRILIEDADGVGFRHVALQHLLAAKLMLEDSDFAEFVMADPLRYSDVVRHAAALRRTDRALLDHVGRVARAVVKSSERGIKKAFDDLEHPFDPDSRIDAASFVENLPPAPAESPDLLDKRLNEMYEQLEMDDVTPSSRKLPERTSDLLSAVALLSVVLAGSELVDDVTLKTQLLKDSIEAWSIASDILNSDPERVASLRQMLEQFFPGAEDEDLAARDRMLDALTQITITLGLGFGAATILDTPGLGVAAEGVVADDEFMSSPVRALYATLLYSELGLPDWPDKLRDLVYRHRAHRITADLVQTMALYHYFLPGTPDNQARKLENLIADLVSGSTTGREGVQERSAARSKLLAQLQRERTKRQGAREGLDPLGDILDERELDPGE